MLLCNSKTHTFIILVHLPHNEKVLALYSSPNIIRLIESRRLGWACHVARLGEEDRCVQGFGKKNLRKRDNL